VEWARVHIRLDNKLIESALRVIYGDGFVLGKDMAMEELVGSTGLDWSKWIPGNRAAAALLEKPAGLLGLLTNSEQVITGLNTTTYNRLGRILAESIGEGRTGRSTAKEILAQMGDVIDDPARALTIAVTETRRAVSTASMQAYAAAGVEQVSWLVAEGEGLCDACRGNSEVSPIPFGDLFPSEDTEPPAHPNCRCAIKPVVAETISQDEFERLFAEYEDITLSGVADMVKYDPDQPRDERGRFSSTGGSTDEGITNAHRIEDIIDKRVNEIVEAATGLTGQVNANLTAGSVKASVAVDIGARMQGNVPVEQVLSSPFVSSADFVGLPPEGGHYIVKLEEAYSDPTYVLTYDPVNNIVGIQEAKADSEDRSVARTPEEKEALLYAANANGMIHNWAITSNDSNVEALAIQQVAERTFGITDAPSWDKLTTGEDNNAGTNYPPSAVAELVESHGEMIQGFLQSQYESTQSFLKSSGIEEVTLYRGIDPRGAGPEMLALTDNIAEGRVANFDHDVAGRPMSSWSTSEMVANQFGAIHLTTTVPASQVLSLPITGIGCLHEKEVVLLGGVIQADVYLKGQKLLKYDEDQPRDENGRFGSTGETDSSRSPKEMAEYANSQQKETIAKLSEEQVTALQDYVSVGGYEEFNEELRLGAVLGLDLAPDTAAKADLMESAIQGASFKDDVVVYRGLNDDEGFYQTASVGDYITDPAFVSTSMDSVVAEMFAVGEMSNENPVVMKITIPAGTPALSGEALAQRLYGGWTGDFDDELDSVVNEVILNRGTPLEVTGTNTSGKITFLEVEVKSW